MKQALSLLLVLALPAVAATHTLDAAQLANAFYVQKSAVAKYDGKPITITGTVQKHEHNGNGEPLLFVGADPTDTYVSLRFVKADEAKASALRVGAPITAICIGDFKILPVAKECHF